MERQVKSNGTLSKVVASYPLPTIDMLLARFKDCKYFLTLNLRLGYYHIKLTKEALAKTAFVTEKGKWQFHLLPFSINLGPSVISYILRTTLKHCQAFALTYLDDIIIFSKLWEDHLEHLKQVFNALQGTDLKKQVQVFQVKASLSWISCRCRKVGGNLKTRSPQNMDELRQFLGLTGFCRKFVPFYADITKCLTKLLKKGIKFDWTEQCESAFNTLKNYAQHPHFSTQTQINLLSFLQMHPITVIQASYTKQGGKTLNN